MNQKAVRHDSLPHLNLSAALPVAEFALRMIDPQTPAEEKEEIEQNLLVYCRKDTLAMVRIREELLNRS